MRYLLLLLLAGCGAAERVEFSSEFVSREDTAAAFERYMAAPIPRWFAMSRDGLHYSSAVCYDQCIYIDLEYVMDACKRRAGRSCVLYARGRKVIWAGRSPI